MELLVEPGGSREQLIQLQGDFRLKRFRSVWHGHGDQELFGPARGSSLHQHAAQLGNLRLLEAGDEVFDAVGVRQRRLDLYPQSQLRIVLRKLVGLVASPLGHRLDGKVRRRKWRARRQVFEPRQALWILTVVLLEESLKVRGDCLLLPFWIDPSLGRVDHGGARDGVQGGHGPSRLGLV